MEVITKYPIIVTNSAAQSDSVYERTYSAANGGDVLPTGTMDVVTKYPIVRTNSEAQTMDEYDRTYSAVFGFLSSPAGRLRRKKRRDARQNKRAENKRTGNTFGNKVKNFAQSDLGKGLLGKAIGGGGDGMGAPVDMGAIPPIEEPPKGMSTGMKIGLIVGGVAILGLAAYFLLRKKGGSAVASVPASAPKLTA